jgi:hypothetical protein
MKTDEEFHFVTYELKGLEKYSFALSLRKMRTKTLNSVFISAQKALNIESNFDLFLIKYNQVTRE